MLELLQAAEPWLPEVLVPPEARGPIRALAAQLPACWEWGMYECRLKAAPERVDFLVYTSWNEGGRDVLAQAMADDPALPALGSARPLLEDWVQEGSVLNRGTPLVWLEYDMIPDRAPDPFVFIQLDPGYLEPRYPSTRSRPMTPLDEVDAIAEAGMLRAVGAGFDRQPLKLLRRCTEALPAGARILHLAAMPQRGVRHIKTGACMYHHEMAGWLRAVGWPGDVKRLDPVFDLLGQGWGRTAIHIDLADEVLPSVALDYQMRALPENTPDWTRMVDRLVGAGLCEPAKGQAVIDWLGGDTIEVPGAAWRVHLERHSFFKIMSHPDGSLEAKTYLGLHPRYTLF